uniref:BTB domain-containing protein n=1 Tax=Panagrolaimus davidi TaxID=227884 RepID=A0A914P334_9BILA
MVKIYRIINEVWTISYKDIFGSIVGQRDYVELYDKHLYYPLKTPNHSKKEITLTKSAMIFPGVIYSLELTTSVAPNEYKLSLFLLASETTASISISFKNKKYRFKNVTSRSQIKNIPVLIDRKKLFAENFEIKIKGLFVIERNEYPIISTISNKELWEGKEKDFEIIVAFVKNDEKTVKIHKQLVIIQSEYFEGMFRSGMEETITNTLKIIDFDFKTVNAAVQFFYGQQIPDTTSIKEMFELLRFADKYFIDNLTDYITTFIPYRFSPSNIVEISNAAVASNFAIKLRKICSEFLVACFEHKIEVKDYDTLNKDFAPEFLQKQ